MLLRKIIHDTNKACLVSAFAQYGELFAHRFRLPVRIVAGSEKKSPGEHLYAFEVKHANSRLHDLLYNCGIVWCNLTVNTNFDVIKMRNMRTGIGYRTGGYQKLFQSVLFVSIHELFHIDRVRFIDVRPKGRAYIDKSELFYDTTVRYKYKSYDMFCRIDLDKCRDIIDMTLAEMPDQLVQNSIRLDKKGI